MLSDSLYTFLKYYIKRSGYFGVWNGGWNNSENRVFPCVKATRKVHKKLLFIIAWLQFSILQIIRFYGSSFHFDDFNIVLLYGFINVLTVLLFLLLCFKNSEIASTINVYLVYMERINSKILPKFVIQ